MTTITPEGMTPTSQETTRKQRNKQAKREAQLMLMLEEAKQAMQKAQRKVAKAQSTLEASKAHLQNCEEALTKRQGQASGRSEQPGAAQ